MARAGARLGHRPVGQRLAVLVVGGGRHAQRIAQRRRGDHRAVRRADHRVHERLGGVEIVAVHADIDLALLDALDGEPVDEGGVGLVVQAAQHGAPGFERELAAIGERARHAFDARALAGIELVGLAFELGAQRLAQPAHRREHLLERLAQAIGGFEQAGIERPHVAFLAEALVARRPPARAPAGAPGPGIPRPVPAPCRRPARVCQLGEGSGLRQMEQAAQRGLGFGVVAQKVAEAAFEAAGAAAAPSLGAQQPAPQVGGLDAAQMRAEGAVGGVEQVMALVEHVAQRARGVVEAAHRRLDHHQRMVGDHDVGLRARAGSCVRRSTCGNARRPNRCIRRAGRPGG